MQLDQTLKNLIFTGIFIIPFIFFIVAPSLLFPFITGKNFAFRIIVEIIFVLWLLLALRNEEYRPKKSWILTITTAFVLIVGIADIFSLNAFKSFWSNFERMEGYIAILHLFAYFLVLGSVFNKEKYWNWFFATFLGSSAFMGIYSLMQLSGKLVINQGGVRVDGTFGNATYLAVYEMVMVFLGLIVFSRAKDKKTALYWLIPLTLLNVYVLYHTATRGAILGLIGGILVASLLPLFFYKGDKNLKRASIGVLAGVLLIIGAFFLLKDASFVKNSPVLGRFSSLSGAEIKTQGRYYIWPMAWQGIKERMLIGWGQESFNFVFNKYYTPKLYSQEQWFDRAHSAPLDWWVASGLLGFLTYIGIFVFLVYYIIKKSSEFSPAEKCLFMGLIAAYFFQSIFVFDNLGSYVLFFTLAAYIYSRTAKEKFNLPEVNGSTSYALGTVLLVFLVFSIYFVNIRPMRAGATLIAAMQSLSSDGLTEKNLALFKKAVAYNTLGKQEVWEQLVSNSDAVFKGKSNDNLKKEYFDMTEAVLKKQVEDTPGDTRAVVFLAGFYQNAGMFEQAETNYKKAIALSPGKQFLYIQLGGLYLNAGKYGDALEILKKGYELEPEYLLARSSYATAALYAGNNQLADSLLKDVPLASLAGEADLINAYVNLKQLPKVIQIFEAKVQASPSDTQSAFSLAALYLQSGNKSKSLEILRNVASKSTNPEDRNQAEIYIKELESQ